MNLPEYPFHEVVEIFPRMTGDAFNDLKADIREHGQREKIWLWHGRIIDGRNRYLVCRELEIPVQVQNWDGEEADLVAFVVSLNLKRRHLDESQRAMVAARLATMQRGRPEQIGKFAHLSQTEAAVMLNVSARSIKSAAVVQQKAAPAVVKAVDAGQVSVSAAAEVARLPIDQQEEIAAAGPTAIVKHASQARVERVQARRVVDETEPPAEESEDSAVTLAIKWSRVTDNLRLYLNSLTAEQIKSLHHILQKPDRRESVRELKELRKTLNRWIEILESRHA